MKICYTYFLLCLFLLQACLPEDTYLVEEVHFNQESQLYGVWEWRDRSLSMIGLTAPPFYYILNGDSSYYSSGLILSNGMGLYYIGKINWTLHDGRFVSMSPDWRSMFNNAFYLYEFDKSGCGFDYNGVHYCAYTVSDPDSLQEALMRFGVDNGKLLLKTHYPDYAITSAGRIGGGQRYLRMVSEHCYLSNMGARSLENACTVSEFKEVDMPVFQAMLSHVDTLSSTEIWEVLQDEAE